MKNEIIKSQIRFPVILRDWLKKSAKESSRSMNAELVEIIKKAKGESEKQPKCINEKAP